jgi:hypothetical protein
MPRPAANRYEYTAVGELVHLDIKKLGRFCQVGKRVAFTTAVIRSYNDRGTPIQRILTDNGSGYRSHAFRFSKPTTSATSAPAHTPLEQTARPKPSSASTNANRPTPTSTPPAATAPKHSPARPGGTTTSDHSAASTATHPSPASHTLRGPTPSYPKGAAVRGSADSPPRIGSCGSRRRANSPTSSVA